ncbi:FxsA family protein [Mycobacterium conspicuum]|uniref:Membrane protein FxsA n=1 Tax=Mycobacterium conspicuum TaxID=44010 RepID=A0A1X1TCE7_9MYCO|nr:FxsA family protein [Mycobacterium conspicuum]ORV42260.1 exclusion suppressor FxsA [Mycobacterium conspicuum]BBZ39979.1 membrane protein FxsA [Mycobacterium conspicuum]
MMRRLLLSYAVVELIVLIGLAATIGVGWTLLVLLATFVLGLVLWAPLAGWQLSSQLAQLRSGLKEPRVALSDGAVVALASGLLLVPGLATTVVGLLLLVPPIRAAASPGLAGIAMRRFQFQVPVRGDNTSHIDYIDGDVIDVEPRVLPERT